MRIFSPKKLLRLKAVLIVPVCLLLFSSFVLYGCSSDSGSDSGSDNTTTKTVTSVTLNHASLNLILGLDSYSSGTFSATVEGNNLEDSDKGVTWSSSNESVATITQEGVVTAVALGDAVITATSKYDTSKTATCSVSVTSPTVVSGWTWTATDYADSITDDSTSITASTVMGNVTVSGSGAVWRTKNSAAYCLQTGTSTNGCLTFTLSEISKVVITAASTGSSNTSDAILSTTASTSGAVAEDSGATTVSGSSPITTLTYSDVAAGTYYFGAFPATSNSRGIRVYTITVTGTSSSGVTVVPPTGIKLTDSTLSFDLNDDTEDTATLTYTLTPYNVTSGYDKVTWSTSDSSVAAVTQAGEVTAKKAGTAVITVTTDTGSFEDKCTVTVTGDAGKTISLTDTPEGYASVGASFTTSGTTTVTTRAGLLSAVSSGNKVIIIDGMIDMSDGLLAEAGSGVTSMTLGTSALDTFVHSTVSTYTDYADWIDKYSAACSETTEDGESSSDNSSLYADLWKLNAAYGNKIKITLNSNTTIIGKDENAGIRGGSFQLSGVSNVQIRNLKLQDAVDPFPHHEQNSNGGSDGYNAQWDCITIQGSCSNIWIDHCTLEDTFKLSYTTKGTEEKWQVYDGLCDMKGASTKITISNCIFKNHDKTMLIGSSDSDGSNSVRFITLYGNYFWNCGQRLPMVRNTTIHILNNYYDSDSSKFYDNSYAVGCRKNCIVYAENNYFGSGIKYSFKDSNGSLYSSGNTDKSSSGCNSTVTGSTLFSSGVGAYTYTAMTAAEAKTNAEENAGAGYTLK